MPEGAGVLTLDATAPSGHAERERGTDPNCETAQVGWQRSLEETARALVLGFGEPQHLTLAHELFMRSAVETERVQEGALELLANTETKQTHRILACLCRISFAYHRPVLQQADKSFLFAMGAATFGFGFIAFTAWCAMKGDVALAFLSGASGAVSHFFTGAFLSIYKSASKERDRFHDCVERTAGFLTANSLCDQIKGDHVRDQARADLIHVIAQTTRETCVLKTEAKTAKTRKPKNETDTKAGQHDPSEHNGNGRKPHTLVAVAADRGA